MIDEKHVLINGKRLLSVYHEDYSCGASGGVALLLIKPPANVSQTLKVWSLIRDYHSWHYFLE